MLIVDVSENLTRSEVRKVFKNPTYFFSVLCFNFSNFIIIFLKIKQVNQSQ